MRTHLGSWKSDSLMWFRYIFIMKAYPDLTSANHIPLIIWPINTYAMTMMIEIYRLLLWPFDSFTFLFWNMSLVWLSGFGGGLGSLGSWVWAPLAAELASGGLTQPVILLKVGEMSTSILVIISAYGLASGRASGCKNIATRKGTMIGAHKKLTPAQGKRL